jgi:hypothetical protein
MFSVTYAEFRHAECHYAEWRCAEWSCSESHYAEWRCAECHYAKWRCAECLYAECRGAYLSPSLKLTSHFRPLTNAALVPSIKITFLVLKMPS